ncbi:MAG: hypothetical protein ACTH31_09955 [Pseudoclavibacter sp.]
MSTSFPLLPDDRDPSRIEIGVAFTNWGIHAVRDLAGEWAVELGPHDELTPREANTYASFVRYAAGQVAVMNRDDGRNIDGKEAARRRLVQTLTATDLMAIGDLFDVGPAEVMRLLTPAEPATLRRPTDHCAEPEISGRGGGL